VYALDSVEEPLSVAEEQTVLQQDVVGESVGEPAAEDAPVEGEPGPGDAVSVPPDEMGEGEGTGSEAGPPVDGDGAADKPAE
jgi:hypothetical protein